MPCFVSAICLPQFPYDCDDADIVCSAFTFERELSLLGERKPPGIVIALEKNFQPSEMPKSQKPSRWDLWHFFCGKSFSSSFSCCSERQNHCEKKVKRLEFFCSEEIWRLAACSWETFLHCQLINLSLATNQVTDSISLAEKKAKLWHSFTWEHGSLKTRKEKWKLNRKAFSVSPNENFSSAQCININECVTIKQHIHPSRLPRPF